MEAPILRNGGFPKLGAPFLGGPCNKDYSILGSIWGSPYFGKPPDVLLGHPGVILGA